MEDMITAKKSKYRLSPSKIVFIIVMLVVPLANFAVFTVYANLGGLVLSFKQIRDGKEVFVFFENFQRFFRLFGSQNYGRIIGTSFAWLPVVLCVMFPITVFMCFFLYKKVPLSRLIIVILFIPNIIPAAVMSEFYRRLWDTGGGAFQSGIMVKLFAFITGGREINWLITEGYANWALFVYTIWFGFGLYSLFIWGAMSRIPEEVPESAQLDGAGLMTELFSITIPFIWPTLSIAIVMYVLTPFTIYMQPLMLAENGRYGTTTIALLIINEIKRPDPYYAAAIKILVSCISFPLALLLQKGLSKLFTGVEI